MRGCGVAQLRVRLGGPILLPLSNRRSKVKGDHGRLEWYEPIQMAEA